MNVGSLSFSPLQIAGAEEHSRAESNDKIGSCDLGREEDIGVGGGGVEKSCPPRHNIEGSRFGKLSK